MRRGVRKENCHLIIRLRNDRLTNKKSGRDGKALETNQEITGTIENQTYILTITHLSVFVWWFCLWGRLHAWG